MSEHDKVPIRKLPTGVPGLDEILGGGLPEYSFNIIAGAPGCGKTTLAHQVVFANASPETPALYFTVLGEPAIKMLRYQQQFSFFDRGKLDGRRTGIVTPESDTKRALAEWGIPPTTIAVSSSSVAAAAVGMLAAATASAAAATAGFSDRR